MRDHRLADADALAVEHRADPHGDRHRLTFEGAVGGLGDLAEIEAHAQAELAMDGQRGVALLHVGLHRDRGAQGVDGAGEAGTGVLVGHAHHAAAARLDAPAQQCLAALQLGRRRLGVIGHQAVVADYVGAQDHRQPGFGFLVAHPRLPPAGTARRTDPRNMVREPDRRFNRPRESRAAAPQKGMSSSKSLPPPPPPPLSE